MSARISRLIIVVALVLGTIVLTLPYSVQAARMKTPIQQEALACRNCPGSGGQLTQAEIEALTYMREEEKLARDAYLKLYDRWHLVVFANIANSESNHMARVKDLLDRYGLPDPAAGKPVGVFSNPVLQQLFNDLMARGSLSSQDALLVGVTIEEVDIQDLQKYLAVTNKSDIKNVFGNLLNASKNHLSAFNYQLSR